MGPVLRSFASMCLLGTVTTRVLGAITTVDSDVAATFDAGDGRARSLHAAVVRVQVDALLPFELTQESDRWTSAGSWTLLPHVLENRGDQARSFHLTAVAQDTGAWTLEDVELAASPAGSGRLVGASQRIHATEIVTVPGRSSLPLQARVWIPAGAKPGDTTTLSIIAREVGTDRISARVDRISVQEAMAPSSLAVSKTASRTTVGVGETLEYVVQVQNLSPRAVEEVTMIDVLPRGFVLDRETIRVEGASSGWQTQNEPGQLSVLLPVLDAGGAVTLRYRVRVSALALGRRAINRATASAPRAGSQVASVEVEVLEEVFTSKGVLFGRVYMDTNADGTLDADDEGVPGVRLYLEDGTSVLTDADGKYSFYGLSARTHVLKLDPTSLPHDVELVDDVGSGGERRGLRWADIRRHELRKVNFVLTRTGSRALREIERRRMAARPGLSEAVNEMTQRLTADGAPEPIADVRARPPSGQVGADSSPGAAIDDKASSGAASMVAGLPVPGAAEASDPSGVPPPQQSPVDEQSTTSLRAVDPELGFVDLVDGMVLPRAQTPVRIKGPDGVRFRLALNGGWVDDHHVGLRAHFPERRSVLWEYVGVDLRPGINRLRAVAIDGFGNERGSVTLQVRAPGELARVTLDQENAEAVADGTSLSWLTVALVDAHGTLVTSRTPVTLATTRGEWIAEDLDPTQPGTQVFVESGRQAFALLSPRDSGEAEIRVNTGTLEAMTQMVFTPDLRPLLMSGVLEGTLHFGTGARGRIAPTDASDAFAEELRSLSATAEGERLGHESRAAFFLKGKIRGDALLTASYDSEKTGERLFRDIQPGEFYPVYGDASVRSFDAQSTGKLYVRVDQGRSYLLVGDFATEPEAASGEDSRTLGAYHRSLNGVRAHHEFGRVKTNLWVSEDSTRQKVREIPADGTSGPFFSDLGEALTNSERVEIVTRDRDQPARVLAERRLTRFSEYEFEPFTGRLLLRAPIPSVDPDLNPIFVRITYEVSEGGPRFWTYGGDVSAAVTGSLTLLGGYARDENPGAPYELGSVGAAYALPAGGRVEMEVAESHSGFGRSGTAGRVEWRHRTEKMDAQVHAARTDESFENSAAWLLAGRVEGGFKINRQITERTTLRTQGLWTEQAATGGRRQGVRADLERAFGRYRWMAGVRLSEESTASAGPSTAGVTPNSVESVRIKVTAPVPRRPQASAYLEYEQDVTSAAQRLGAAGFDYRLVEGGRAYARHEFISALGGPFELNSEQRQRTTVVGLDRAYMKDGQWFNEYRASNEITGREAEAAVGLRNGWTVADGVRAHTSFERVTPVSGVRPQESTSVTGALEYRRQENWRAQARAEWRRAAASESVLSLLGYARQLGSDWTFLGKSIALTTQGRGPGGSDSFQGRLQTGLAWRPAKSDRWNALGKYELKAETNQRAVSGSARRTVHLFSGDVNFQPDLRWVIHSHLAVKTVAERDPFDRGQAWAYLVGGGVRHHFTRRWDVGLQAYLSGDGGQARWKVAGGPEIGFHVTTDAVVGLGFNLIGFRDRDFSAETSTAQGFFLRLRLKLDETWLPRGVREARKS